MRFAYAGDGRPAGLWLCQGLLKGWRQKKRQDGINAHLDGKCVCEVRPRRIYRAVGEVEEADGFVDHRETEG